MINRQEASGLPLIQGYRPEAYLRLQVKRQLRDLQTLFPAIRPAKFALFNWGTRNLGMFVEPEIRLLARLAPIGLAVDVGGNWGQTVHALRRHASPARILSFEPNPVLAEHLRDAFAGEGRVEILAAALGREAGEAVLHIPSYRRFMFDGLASLDRHEAADWLNGYRMARFDPARLTIESHVVPVQTLDALNISPDVIKIDTQGTELDVALGAVETLGRCQPVVIAERPNEAFVHILGRLGLAPYGWNGQRLVAGDMAPNNTLFLAAKHLSAMGLTGR